MEFVLADCAGEICRFTWDGVDDRAARLHLAKILESMSWCEAFVLYQAVRAVKIGPGPKRRTSLESNESKVHVVFSTFIGRCPAAALLMKGSTPQLLRKPYHMLSSINALLSSFAADYVDSAHHMHYRHYQILYLNSSELCVPSSVRFFNPGGLDWRQHCAERTAREGLRSHQASWHAGRSIAVRSDLSDTVVTWGDREWGGDSSKVQQQLKKGATQAGVQQAFTILPGLWHLRSL